MAYIDKMKAQEYIDKTRDYLNYLEEHIYNVKRAFTELTNACKSLPIVVDDYSWHTLREQIVWHDVSKLTKEEFIQYRDNFFSVSDKDKKNSCFGDAWENHKKENHHHHETAKDFLDIFHMVVDWTAMGYKFGDTAQNYYENNKDRIKLTDEQIDFMYQILIVLSKIRRGNDKTRSLGKKCHKNLYLKKYALDKDNSFKIPRLKTDIEAYLHRLLDAVDAAFDEGAVVKYKGHEVRWITRSDKEETDD